MRASRLPPWAVGRHPDRQAGRVVGCGRRVVVQLGRGAWHDVVAGEPAAEIDLGAARAAERAAGGNTRAVADRATRGGTDGTGRQFAGSLSGGCVTTMNIAVETAACTTLRPATRHFLPTTVRRRRLANPPRWILPAGGLSEGPAAGVGPPRLAAAVGRWRSRLTANGRRGRTKRARACRTTPTPAMRGKLVWRRRRGRSHL